MELGKSCFCSRFTARTKLNMIRPTEEELEDPAETGKVGCLLPDIDGGLGGGEAEDDE